MRGLVVIFGLGLGLGLGLGGCASPSSVVVDPALELGFYQATVDGLRGRGKPVDPALVNYARLRQAATFERGGRDLSVLAQTLASARASGDHAKALRAAEELLESDFTDAQAHLEKARSLHLGDARAAVFHETIALGLLQSILATGEVRGRPLRVFSEREEDAVAAFLGLRPTRRQLHWVGTQRIDEVDCQDHRRRLVTLRFDATPPQLKKPTPPGAP